MNQIIHKITYILLIICSASILQAQVGFDEHTWEEDLDRATTLLGESSYYNAAEYIQKVIDVRPDEPQYVQLLADTYNKARDYNMAGQYYSILLDSMQIDSALATSALRYEYAQMLKQDGRCREAIDQFNQFIADFKGTQEEKDLYTEKVKNQVEGCELFLQGPTDDDYPVLGDINVLEAGIGSGYTEFAPYPAYNDYLIFSSLEADEYIYTNIDKTKSKIYTAKKVDDAWVQQDELEGPFNLDGEHTGHGAYSSDGNSFYFTRCPSLDNNLVKCQIYSSRKELGEWTTPVMLGPEVNTEAGESTTPLMVDFDGEQRLYFTSDRDGTVGGTDIWYATVVNDSTFTQAVNLGKDINTIGNETTPYVVLDKKESFLYFSSDHHPGFGGYDVFRAAIDGSRVGTPVNLGLKINTGADDMYFIMNEDQDEGFLVSNRGGATHVDNATCCDNIYRFAPVPPTPPAITIKGTICDADDYKKPPLEGVEIRLYDVTTGEDILVGKQVSNPEYKFENLEVEKDYILVIDQEGYIPIEQPVSTRGIEEDKEIIKDICVSKTGMTVNGTVYSDDGTDVEILPGATVTLYEVMEDGTLREVESVISDENGNYSFFLPEGKDYRIVARKDCYLNTSTEDFTTKGLDSQTSINRDIYMKLDAPITYRLDNIYYDFDDSKLRPESEVALDKLLRLLYDNPQLEIELSSHTDSRGGNRYNQKLSERRAKSVVDYLIGRGITPQRMKPVGYGELVPIAPNENPDGSDNPEGRQLNRRTEFKIISKSPCYPGGYSPNKK